MRIFLQAGSTRVEIEILSTPTAKALAAALPFESRAQTWGEEVYGRTPISTDARPKLANPCNVLGKVLGDPKTLAKIKSGDVVKVEKA